MGEIRVSWDFLLVSPLVLNYLKSREYPFFVSCTVIQDYLERLPEIASQRIVRMEWNIAHALNECGYRRISNTGKGFVRASLGLQTVPEPAMFRQLVNIAM